MFPAVFLAFPPKLVTWGIVLHLHIVKQAKSGWRRWPALRGKLRLLQLFHRRLQGREGVAFAPMIGSVELQFETWGGGLKWRDLGRDPIVAFPRKRHVVLDRNGSCCARLLGPVVWQGWWWRRRQRGWVRWRLVLAAEEVHEGGLVTNDGRWRWIARASLLGFWFCSVSSVRPDKRKLYQLTWVSCEQKSVKLGYGRREIRYRTFSAKKMCSFY